MSDDKLIVIIGEDGVARTAEEAGVIFVEPPEVADVLLALPSIDELRDLAMYVREQYRKTDLGAPMDKAAQKLWETADALEKLRKFSPRS